ncbi:hypothetical protein [Treponema sp. R80B11-R83G3]
MKKICVILIFMAISVTVYGQTVLLRPNASIGYFSSSDMKGLSYDYGMKILLFANEFQRYGVKIDHLNFTGDNALSYLGTGLFIEQILFKYFNMGIGTVGYINLQQGGDNPFGIYTHLGFEYSFGKYFNILAAYQSEFIFRKHFTMNNAFTLGLGFKI